MIAVGIWGSPLGAPFVYSPGFGGLMAVVAAAIAAVGVAATLAQRSRAERREQWWSRFSWLVDRAGTQLDLDLVIAMLDQLAETARRLRDPDLVAFAEHYFRTAYASWLAEGSPIGRHSGHTGPMQGGQS